jgi:hypothetical protein
VRTRFPPVAAFLRELVYGAEPVGAAGAAVLDKYAKGTVSGGPMGGIPHFGMKGDPATTFGGYVADPQVFQGAAQIGASSNLSVEEYPALPSAVPPEHLPTWLQDWTQLEGVIQ